MKGYGYLVLINGTDISDILGIGRGSRVVVFMNLHDICR